VSASGWSAGRAHGAIVPGSERAVCAPAGRFEVGPFRPYWPMKRLERSKHAGTGSRAGL